jgi:hypothetical protein
MRLKVFLASFAAAGCCMLPQAPPPTTSVESVVNALKRELTAFAETPPGRLPGPGKVCVAKNATSYQTVGTEAVTLDLDVDHEQNVTELNAGVEALGKQIDVYNKAAARFATGDKTLATAITKMATEKEGELKGLYKSLAKAPEDPDDPTGDPNPPKRLEGHNLAATLWTLREGLLAIDHSLKPCVKPTLITTQIDFQVVRETKGGLDLEIYVVSVGASAAKKDDATQSLKVTFDMTGGGAGPLVPP